VSDLSRRPGNRPTRRQTEQRAYRLTLAAGTAGLATVVTAILALVDAIGWGLPLVLAVVTILLVLALRRLVGR
jgi:hypothetical protein